jgi:hypothetical protein
MRLLARVLVGVVVVALSACGSDKVVTDVKDQVRSTSMGGRATAVSVIRSGGLKGGRVAIVYKDGTRPPKGKTAADVRQALRAASDPALLPIRLVPPDNPCCDRYEYVITITYVNGSTKHFSTVDGEPWPPAFRAFMRAIN